MINQPTRMGNLLDLVLTSTEDLISELEVREPFGTSDHDSVTIGVIIKLNEPDNCTQPDSDSNFRNWPKADWELFEQYCYNINWPLLVRNCCNSDEYWECLTSVLKEGINRFVPLRNNNNNKSNKKKTKLPKTVRKLKNKKKKFWKKVKASKSKVDQKKFNAVARDLKKAMRAEEVAKELDIIESHDLNRLHKYLRSVKSHNDGVAPLKDSSGALITSPPEVANILNDTFISLGTVDNGNIPLLDKRELITNELNIVYFAEIEIFGICSGLKQKFSVGPDGIPSVVFKNLAHVLATPLSMIFGLIMQTGILPAVWKTAYVVPIFKKGSTSDAKNYRPISLTCIGCKIFETIVKKHLLSHLNSNNFINKAQHGFLAKRSTVTNLLEFMADLTTNFNVKSSTLVTYIDFQKAFDKVSSAKLLQKIDMLGIGGQLRACLASFLTGRSQRVKISGILSESKPLISGVPQGSVLGPILFAIYVNDLPNILPPSVKSKIFADDFKCYSKISSIVDIDITSEALNRITDWAEAWQMPFSMNKSTLMLFSHSVDLISGENLKLNNCVLESTRETLDLGVIFQSNFKFTAHIDSVCNKAKQRLYVLRKKIISSDASTLILVYKMYVLPILLYCSPIWSPHAVEEKMKLESIQKSFTKRLPGFADLNYKERLVKANLKSLELERVLNDMILCYKILHEMVDIDKNNILSYDANSMTRGHGLKLRANKPTCNDSLYSYSYRVIKIWNCLSPNTVWAPTLGSFKRYLLNEDLGDAVTLNYDTFNNGAQS
jgi:hypothetical protein